MPRRTADPTLANTKISNPMHNHFVWYILRQPKPPSLATNSEAPPAATQFIAAACPCASRSRCSRTTRLRAVKQWHCQTVADSVPLPHAARAENQSLKGGGTKTMAASAVLCPNPQKRRCRPQRRPFGTCLSELEASATRQMGHA